MFPDIFSLNTDATLQDLIVFANGKKRPKTIGNIPVCGELDKKTALKKSGMSSGGVSIFRVVLTILLLSTGIRMLLKKRDQKEDGKVLRGASCIL